MNLINLFDKPKMIGIVANTNEGKSNLIYYIINQIKEQFNTKIYTYGLRTKIKGLQEFHSVEELEQIQDSVIFIDEMFNLFDLDNRKVKSMIEKTIRLLFHKNNILVLTGLGENFKKFLSAKVHAVIYKKVTLSDLINGSRIKNILMAYTKEERGSTILNLNIDEALVYDGLRYHKINVPYMEQYDSKARNVPILVPKIVPKTFLKCANKKDFSDLLNGAAKDVIHPSE